jgi:hypothetical protein
MGRAPVKKRLAKTHNFQKLLSVYQVARKLKASKQAIEGWINVSAKAPTTTTPMFKTSRGQWPKLESKTVSQALKMC